MPAPLLTHCRRKKFYSDRAVGRVALNLPHSFAILRTPFVVDVSLSPHTRF